MSRKIVSIRTLLCALASVVLVFSSVQPAAAIIIDHELIEKFDVTQYDGRVGVCDESDGNQTPSGDLDRFLQVLADQESGGNPRAENDSSTASGKYQYLDGTWQTRTQGTSAIYPPAHIYGHAASAPEAMQDAVAYIEYAAKFEEFNGDFFKMAITHYRGSYPDNESELDIVPPGNTLTYREYGEAFLGRMTEGVGTNIPLKYRDAPQFDQYNTSGLGGEQAAAAPTEAPTQADTPAGGGKKVFLDPGHGAAIDEYADPVTRLHDRETSNGQESEDVLQVARRVKTQLETDGYTVTLARNDNQTPVNKRERVNAAKEMGADIAVSIHTTPDNINDVWPQRTGTYREYRNTRVTFDNDSTAERSQQYARAIAGARHDSEDRDVSLDPNGTHQENSFSRDDLPSKGNISLVQLWSTDVPWVYNEFAHGDTEGLSETDKQKYAEGLVDGIEEALGSNSATNDGTDTDCGDGQGDVPSGDFTQTILDYAWPTYHSPNYFTMKPGYQAAVTRAQSEGRYVGGGSHPGIDCGGFVTTLMVDSGFEPRYNSNGRGGPTGDQQAWAEANWQKLGTGSDIDTGSLRAGDVAFSPGHTFVYVGTISGFSKKVASASYSPSNIAWRTPMAGSESPAASNVTWYRKR